MGFLFYFSSPSLLFLFSPVEMFNVPIQLEQTYVEVPCKERLVALAVFLRQKIVETKGNDCKMILFVSNCDSVDFHYNLFGRMKLERKADRKSLISNNNNSNNTNSKNTTTTTTTTSKSNGKSKSPPTKKSKQILVGGELIDIFDDDDDEDEDEDEDEEEEEEEDEDKEDKGKSIRSSI